MSMVSYPKIEAPEALFSVVAREIAVNFYEIDEILTRHSVTPERWDRMKSNAVFQRMLAEELSNWNSALNTHERAKLKASAMIEEWLPEANARLHATTETLTAKTELAKLLARIAGMGLTGVGVEGASGEKFSVTINIGEGREVRIEKQIAPRVIEGEMVE